MAQPVRRDAQLLNDIVDYCNGARHNEFQTARFYRDAKSLVSESPTANSLSALGLIQGIQRDFESAIGTFRTAVDMDQFDVGVRGNYASILMDAGYPQRAREQFMTCWDRSEGNPKPAMHLIDACALSGRFFEAQRFLRIVEGMKVEIDESIFHELIDSVCEVATDRSLDDDDVAQVVAVATEVLHENGYYGMGGLGVSADDDAFWVSMDIDVPASPAQVVEMNMEMAERVAVLPCSETLGTGFVFTFKVAKNWRSVSAI